MIKPEFVLKKSDRDPNLLSEPIEIIIKITTKSDLRDLVNDLGPLPGGSNGWMYSIYSSAKARLVELSVIE